MKPCQKNLPAFRTTTIATLLTVLLAACSGGGGSSGAPTSNSAANAATVTLAASGSAPQATISYAVNEGASTQVTVALPWSTTVPLTANQTLSATATNTGSTGTVGLQVSGGGLGTVNGSGTSSAAVRYTCCN